MTAGPNSVCIAVRRVAFGTERFVGIDAFKKTGQYPSAKTIGGMTPLERFFLGFGLGWAQHRRDEVVRDLFWHRQSQPSKDRSRDRRAKH